MAAERLRRLARSLGRLDAVDLALRLTLLDLLLRPIGDWTLRPWLLAGAAAGLLVRAWLRSPLLWFPLAALTALRVALDWPFPDNHAYLLAYWCLAIALALAAAETGAFLALNGRMLIGLAFAFATLWKLALSPDYLDGTFFRVQLLTDPRLDAFVQLFGGLTPDLLEAHREALARHVDGLLLEAGEVPAAPPRFHRLADLLTWGTVGVEAVIAVAFLWPTRGGLARVRDAALLLFCATAYAVVPVEGFGWLLVAMGVAQCEPGRRATRVLYLLTFALILLYREVPWASLWLERLRAGSL